MVVVTEFPVLYNMAKNGKVHYWKIYVEGDKMYRESWYEQGKTVTYPVVECKGKNKGKANETTSVEQASAEAKSKWVKQFDKGYKVLENGGDMGSTPSAAVEKKLFPMLAQKFTEKKHNVHLPCAVSRKLDGVRMMATLKEGSVQLTSRTSKEFAWMNTIREHVKKILEKFGGHIVLDGELYSHALSFSELCGAVRNVKSPSACEDKIEYWIFDIADENLVYENRVDLLVKIKKWYENTFAADTTKRCIKFELYETVNQLDQCKEYHDKYVAEGFEGMMVRNLNGFYKFKFRSNDLQKYKDFEDAEFEIVGFKTGVSTEKDAIIYTCKYGDQTFDVRPRGSIEERIERAKMGHSFIGKKLIVRYQPCTKQEDVDRGDLPRFPVGIEIRDYE